MTRCGLDAVAGGRDLPAPARLRTTARVCVGATGSRSSARHGIGGPRVSPGPAYGGRHPPLAGSRDLTPAWCDLTPAARARGRPGARGARGWRTSSTGLPCGSAPRRPLDWQSGTLTGSDATPRRPPDWQSGTLTGGPPAANPPDWQSSGRRDARTRDGAGTGRGGTATGRGRDGEDAHTGVGSLRDMPLPEHLAATLSAEVADAQRSWRTPGLSVGVARDGELAWSSHVGLARLDPPTRGARRHPGDDRLDHQDLHRGAGHAAARRGPARPRGPARDLAARVAARLADRPATAQPHVGSAARARRAPLGEPRRAGRRPAASPSSRTPSRSSRRTTRSTTRTSPSPCSARSSNASASGRGRTSCGSACSRRSA